MSTIVNLYSSAQLGAPVLSGTAGALKTLLKTCLVDGFGASPVQSITVTDGTAVATFASPHPYTAGGPIQITGAAPAALNGTKRVKAVTSLTVSFDAPGVPNTTATAGIAAKVPAAGWQELFPGTANVLCVKPNAPEASGMVLRVDDVGETGARVRGYEGMSDAHTGVGPCPTVAQAAGSGLFWSKSSAASGAARSWFLAASDRFFYLSVGPAYSQYHTIYFAGDIESFKSGDAWGWMLTGDPAAYEVSQSEAPGCISVSNRAAISSYLSRSYTGIGAAVGALRVGAGHNAAVNPGISGSNNYSFGSSPNMANYGLLLAPVEIVEGSVKRGLLPNALHLTQNGAGSFPSGELVAGTGKFAGHTLLALRTSAANAQSYTPIGNVFIDLGGA